LWEYVVPSLLAVCVPLATYFLIKREVSDVAIAEKVAALIENLSTDEQTLAKLYQVGGVLGAGLVQGSGLNGLVKGNRGGKINMKDFFMQLAIGFVQSKAPQLFGQTGQQETPQGTASTDLNIS